MTYEEKAKLEYHLNASAEYHTGLSARMIARGDLSLGQMELVQQFRDKAQEARDMAAAIFA